MLYISMCNVATNRRWHKQLANFNKALFLVAEERKRKMNRPRSSNKKYWPDGLLYSLNKVAHRGKLTTPGVIRV